MGLAGANLIEPGDRALVVNTGYFSDRFATLLERYGAQVTQARAAVGALAARQHSGLVGEAAEVGTLL